MIPAKPEPVDQPVPASDDEEIIPEEEYSKGFKRRHPPDQDDENWNKSPKREEKDFDGLIIDHSLNFPLMNSDMLGIRAHSRSVGMPRVSQ